MKLLKYFLSALIFLVMVVIVLLTTPIFLLIDGGMGLLQTILAPTAFGKVLTSVAKS